jgi:tRNA threonylcarbamoyladenosine biosynthesis protein TsaB
MKDLDAVAVSNGPGSYTGLRIGLSAAKGICFALQIPLITIATLEIMAEAARNQVNDGLIEKTDWLCPMIDARRMEVYYAVYDPELLLIHPPQAANADDAIFSALVEKKKVLFFGNGSFKVRNTLVHDNAFFTDNVKSGASDMISLSNRYYRQNKLADLAYAEPLYIKEFYSPLRK